MAFERTLESMKKEFEKRLAEDRKVQQHKLSKLSKEYERYKEEVEEVLQAKNIKIEG